MLTNSFMSSREAVSTYSVIAGSGDIINNAKIESIGFKLIPDQINFLQYYDVLLRKPKFLIMFWNSVIVTIPILLGQIMVSALAAFAFSKLRFPFRNTIFFIYIIVMMMPFQVTLVPNYIMLKKLDLLGTYWAVILPGVFTTFGVFLLRQFMMLVPDEYCEAGRIDGAGHFVMFMKIILPQCKGVLASLAILVFVDNWNMVEQPLIFLKDETMYPLSIFLFRINAGDIGLAFACGVLYMLPALVTFLYGENYFVEGIQLSGIK
jgi:multiple sugar transport system permease protein